LRVVATFTILGDWVREIGGDDVELVVLVGPDADPHAFDPTPRQQAAVAGADLVIANGLGLEPWLERTLVAADFKGRLVTASSSIEPLRMAGQESQASPPVDPHAFQDPTLAQTYVLNISVALSEADPVHAEFYASRTRNYIAALQSVDRELANALAPIPQNRRRVLTSHDAFAYFGRAFDFDFVPITSRTENSEASPSTIAKIANQAREGQYSAVFVENMRDARLSEAIAAEASIRISGELYADALSKPDGPAPTYLDLLRHNAKVLVEALR